MFSLLLSTFCAEQVEGVILSHFYFLSFLVIGLLPKRRGWAHESLETAQSQNSSFPFLFEFGLGLGT